MQMTLFSNIADLISGIPSPENIEAKMMMTNMRIESISGE
jgi:hypothetical protein